MRVERYDFPCQRAVHDGMKLAKSLGHQFVEVEHVLLALISANQNLLKPEVCRLLMQSLQASLYNSQKSFGRFKIAYGNRLVSVFAELEASYQVVLKGIFLRQLAQASPSVQVAIKEAIDRQQVEELGDSPDSQASVRSWRPEVFNGSEKNEEESEKETTTLPKDVQDQEWQIDKKSNRILRKYTIDLTELAERSRLDPVIGRDQEVLRVMEILGRKKKNNPLLVGKPGVGKTAIAELLAIRIAENRVPETLAGVRVLSLDLGLLLSGAKYRGEFEQRLKEIVGIIEKVKNRVILFVDELHMVMGMGAQEGGADVANLLKPSLARGELRCLGATTLKEYRKYIESDPAFSRRFQPVLIGEPTEDDCLAILRGLKTKYEIYHEVTISDAALIAAVKLSKRYLSYRVLPDKAVDLIDEAASKMHMQMYSMPSKLGLIRLDIERLELEKGAIEPREDNRRAIARLEVKLQIAKDQFDRLDEVWKSGQQLHVKIAEVEQEVLDLERIFSESCGDHRYDFAVSLQQKNLPEKKRELQSLRDEMESLRQEFPFVSRVVGVEEVAEVVASWTGIPVMRMLKGDKKHLLEMEQRLQRFIFGQEKAVIRLCQALKRAKMGVNDPARPVGVFLFLGQSGVGKTETVKVIAEELFHGQGKLVRLDMSEYMEQHNMARLIGSPPGYVGHGEGGELTEAIRRHPYSVVLIDEVEKAHKRVLDILLQVFEDGRLTDGKGETVDFRHCLFVMTSNVKVPESSGDERRNDNMVRRYLMGNLRPEFVGRVDEIVIFNPLRRKHLEMILDRFNEEFNHRLLEREMRVALGPQMRDRLLMVDEGGGAVDARTLRRRFQREVIDHLADWLITHGEDEAKGAWLIDLEEGRWEIKLDDREHWLLSSG